MTFVTVLWKPMSGSCCTHSRVLSQGLSFVDFLIYLAFIPVTSRLTPASALAQYLQHALHYKKGKESGKNPTQTCRRWMV